MGFFDIGKGEICLTFYDIGTGSIIREPIQVEICRGISLVGIRIIKDGKLKIDNLPRVEHRPVDFYYSYTLKITSNKYKMKEIECEFDKHTKKIELDIALEYKGIDNDTRMY